ncbi:hypothetical protein DFH11DRAFT_988461 [Phellopilus nigrolimitatus]|nr:hypothetical protein DFH11DRAFT_988461 [Phellopilus nigrolimitatus]
MLELPALMSLVVDMVDMIAQTQTWTHVTNLLYRSNSPLEMLTLLRTPMSEEDVLKCLRRCPRLIYLNLAPMTDNILRALLHQLEMDRAQHALLFALL